MAVRAGDTVLIQGGAGGVGHVAVQLARAFGAEVFATGSAHSRAVIERLGATFIERTEPVSDYVQRLTGGRGFDRVYDTAGGAALEASFQAVRRFGHVVSCLGWGTYALAPLSFKEATYSGVFILPPLLSGEGRRHHREILDQARQLVESGRLLPVLEARQGASWWSTSRPEPASGRHSGNSLADWRPRRTRRRGAHGVVIHSTNGAPRSVSTPAPNLFGSKSMT
jgi:NADPH2:quinone reductase